VGSYRVLARLGEGGMATVYRAAPNGGGGDVALKVLRDEISRSREFVRRFQREAKAATLLTHANTVRILEYGVDGPHVFIAMELLHGRDLFELLVAEERLAEARAARIMVEVCDGLQAAHELGIVHRDLKPENIMVFADPADPSRERVKVLDFGIAKLLDPDDALSAPAGQRRSTPQTITRSALTRLGTLIGTPEYIAPEQGRSEPIDARSDVYACGVVLYQMVTGRAPFTGDSPLQIVVRHVREAPKPPRALVPELHFGLERVILRALAKLPGDRHQSAAELRDALLGVLPELPAQKRPSAPPGPDGPAPLSAKRRTSGSALTIPLLDLAAVVKGDRDGDDPPIGVRRDVDDDDRTNVMPDMIGGLRRRRPGEELPTLQNLGPSMAAARPPRVEVVEAPRAVPRPLPPAMPLRPAPLATPKSVPQSSDPTTPALVAPTPVPGRLRAQSGAAVREGFSDGSTPRRAETPTPVGAPPRPLGAPSVGGAQSAAVTPRSGIDEPASPTNADARPTPVRGVTLRSQMGGPSGAGLAAATSPMPLSATGGDPTPYTRRGPLSLPEIPQPSVMPASEPMPTLERSKVGAVLLGVGIGVLLYGLAVAILLMVAK
jgi:serine/threonine-protein kinase